MSMGHNFSMPFKLLEENRSNYVESTSSSSSDSEEENLSKDYFDSTVNITQYSSIPTGFLKLSSDTRLSPCVVSQIEKDLDFNDTISMVFLLYEENLALNVILTILSAGPHKFSRDLFSRWAYTNPSNWSLALVEALSVTQNYKILTNMGYNKSVIDKHFNPKITQSLHLNIIKKVLYLLCENLTKEEIVKLIEFVRNDVHFHNDITNNFNYFYLEFFLLFWNSRGYISLDKEVSLEKLIKHLKEMRLFDRVKELENTLTNKSNHRKRFSQDHCTTDSDAYPIQDPNNVGVCIIMNIATFEKNVESKKEDQHSLDNREGSFQDVKKLKDTFRDLMFKVVEIHDVRSYDFKSVIQSSINKHFEKNVHSVLTLCILSHGDRGVVFGSDGKTIDIANIRTMISDDSQVGKLLSNIPKVIIIQACQGLSHLFVEPLPNVMEQKSVQQGKELQLDSSDLQLDCPHHTPKYADFITCYANIEGYSAVRSKTKGSLYIQEFCKCLKNYYKKDHILDIVTIVHSSLNKYLMHVPSRTKGQGNCTEHLDCLHIYMTPEVKHTLRKKLYLTPFKLSNLSTFETSA